MRFEICSTFRNFFYYREYLFNFGQAFSLFNLGFFRLICLLDFLHFYQRKSLGFNIRAQVKQFIAQDRLARQR